MILPQAEPLIICDASPLILLAKISHAALLFQIAREVWIPDAVWDEITRNSGSPPELPSLLSLFSQSVRAADQPLQAAFQTQVDAGEAAALALATRHPAGLLLMDDRRGRSLAKHHGLRCLGTLGLLARAKRQGFITEVKPLLKSLRTHGMFLAAELEQQTLLAVGEA